MNYVNKLTDILEAFLIGMDALERFLLKPIQIVPLGTYVCNEGTLIKNRPVRDGIFLSSIRNVQKKPEDHSPPVSCL